MRDILGVIFGLAGGAALTAVSQIYPPTSPFWHVVLYVSIGVMLLVVVVFGFHLVRKRPARMIAIDALIVLSLVGLVMGLVLRSQYAPFARPQGAMATSLKPPVMGGTLPAPAAAVARQYSNRTPKDIIALQGGVTLLQSAKLTDPYKGVWVRFDSVVPRILPDSQLDHSYGYFNSGGVEVECRFGPQWYNQLVRANEGDPIKIEGRINTIHQNHIGLLECEIL